MRCGAHPSNSATSTWDAPPRSAPRRAGSASGAGMCRDAGAPHTRSHRAPEAGRCTWPNEDDVIPGPLEPAIRALGGIRNGIAPSSWRGWRQLPARGSDAVVAGDEPERLGVPPIRPLRLGSPRPPGRPLWPLGSPVWPEARGCGRWMGGRAVRPSRPTERAPLTYKRAFGGHPRPKRSLPDCRGRWLLPCSA